MVSLTNSKALFSISLPVCKVLLLAKVITTSRAVLGYGAGGLFG
jgi:hypothetical protein